MKKPTREDERKLFEAYETLDRLLNDHNLVNDLCKEKINKVFNEVRVLIRGIVFQIYTCKKMQYYEQSALQMKLENAIDELEKECLK